MLCMGVLLSCGGSDTPSPKTDQKATYTPGTLPTGVSLSGTLLTVPETITDADLKKAFENGTVTDPDGKAGITTVAINKNSLTVTYYGTDGTNTAQTKSYTTTFTIKRVAVTAQFPATIITGNSFTAGTENIFAPLFSLQIPLSDGTTVQPTKILINDQEVTATHIIYKPGKHKLQLQVKDSKGNTLNKEYTLKANYKEAVYADIVHKPNYQLLGIEMESANYPHKRQSHSKKWLQLGIENNEKYGYFDAKIAISALNPSRKKKIEEQLRASKVAWTGAVSRYTTRMFLSDKIEDSNKVKENTIERKFDDHDEAQLRNRLGENQVGLQGDFDL